MTQAGAAAHHRWRGVAVVVASVALHAVLLWASLGWHALGRGPAGVPVPPAAPPITLTWVAPASLPAVATAPSHTPRPAAALTSPAAHRGGRPAPAAAPPRTAVVVAAPPAAAGQPPSTTSVPLQAVAPQPPASDAPAPLAVGPDDIARAVRSGRMGAAAGMGAPQAAVPPARWGAAPGAALGGATPVQADYGAGGTRVSRVQGLGGSYCVEIPSANQAPSMGAAPRIAAPTNCR